MALEYNKTPLEYTLENISLYRKNISESINKNCKIFNDDEPKLSIENLFNKLEKLLDELKSFMNKIMEKIRAYKTKPKKYTEDLLKNYDDINLISSNRRDSKTDSLEKSIDKSLWENEVETSSSSNKEELEESNSSFAEKIKDEKNNPETSYIIKYNEVWLSFKRKEYKIIYIKVNYDLKRTITRNDSTSKLFPKNIK